MFVAPTPRSVLDSGPDDGVPWLPGPRLGVTVTRKVGKAVKRNRIKRLVREAYRRERASLPVGIDMVWVAKRDAVDGTLDAVVHDMRSLGDRLRREPVQKTKRTKRSR